MQYELPHEVQDAAKVEQIAASMRANGWQGAPVLVWEGYQLTGVHRTAAAELAGIDLETIELREVFAQDGADFDAAIADYINYPYGDVYAGITLTILPHLSDTIKAEYGIDLH